MNWADTCMTSIFSSSWVCGLCDREACAACFEQVKELMTDRVGAPEAEIAALQAWREKHAHINPFFLLCTRRNEHQAKDFSPMSRFCKAELTQAIEEMEALVKRSGGDAASAEEVVETPTIKSSPKMSRDLWGSTSPGSSSSCSAAEGIKSAGRLQAHQHHWQPRAPHQVVLRFPRTTPWPSRTRTSPMRSSA